MKRIPGRLIHLAVLAVIAAAGGCGTEGLVTGPIESSNQLSAATDADTGSVLRAKWLARLDARELAMSGPDRWFSMHPGDLQHLRATRALLDSSPALSNPVPANGARRSLDDDYCWAICLYGGTDPSITGANIMVATLANEQVFRLEYAGYYNVYLNGKALGGGSYRDQVFRAAGFGSTTHMNIGSLPSDTVEVTAVSQHNGEASLYSPTNSLRSAASFGHDIVRPPLPPVNQIDYQTQGSGGADDGMLCLLHYRSYDGGRTWYFLWADNCMEGKYKSVLAPGALPSASVTGERSEQSSAPASVHQKGSGTLVVLGQDKLENGQRAAVYVRPGFSPEAVIAVDRKRAKPIDIADALAVLMKFRTSAASRETGSLHRLAVMERAKAGSLPPTGRARFAGYLGAFAKAPRVSVPGVGDGNAIEVWLPDTQ
jgi:hypothetical protein